VNNGIILLTRPRKNSSTCSSNSSPEITTMASWVASHQGSFHTLIRYGHFLEHRSEHSNPQNLQRIPVKKKRNPHWILCRKIPSPNVVKSSFLGWA
jgi:hypothetical protein